LSSPIEPLPINFVGSENNRLNASLYRSDERSTDTKPAALFMHGGGQTRHSWDGAARQIAELGVDAYTVDARGHGDSEWVENGHYAFPYYRDDLITIAQQIKEQSGGLAPLLVGASMGGISAMLAQGDHPAIFSALILVDITPRMEASGVDKIMGFMSKDMKAGFADVNEAADVIAAYLPDRKRPRSLDGLKKNLREHEDGRLYWHWDPAFVEGPHSILAGGEDVHDLLFASAGKISMPTLLVRGNKSELVTQESADEFLSLVPHADYVDVTDAGHMVAGDKNDVFANAVIEFLHKQNLV